MRAREQQWRAMFYELCSMIIQILKSPLFPIPIPISRDPYSSSSSSSGPHPQVTFSQVSPTPTAFGCLFLGISLALMLFGSVTFIIGFILLPCVIGLIFIFHFVGVVSSLSDLCRSFVVSKDVPSWRLSSS